MTKASHRLTVCQADHEALGDLLLRSLQAVHCKYGRGQNDAEAALALQVEALHCAVSAAHQEAFVAACNPQRQCLHAPESGILNADLNNNNNNNNNNSNNNNNNNDILMLNSQ